MRPSVASPLALALALVAVLPACGAMFPRYVTTTRSPPQGVVAAGMLSSPPESVQRIAVVEAEVPTHKADGSPWDSDGAPDVYAVLYRNDVELLRTPVASNTLHPTWNVAVTAYVTPNTPLRVELWDEDGVLDDAIGRMDLEGVPTTALNDGVWRVTLERGATVRLRATPPAPLLGAGITYEVHSEYLLVLEVVSNGPAGRAGLRPDDRITAIGGRSVADLEEQGARQALDRAAFGEVDLTVVRGSAAPMNLHLPNDAVYPAR